MDKYVFANMKRKFFRSRRIFLIIFSIFLVVGALCVSDELSTNTQAFGISLIAGCIISIATLWIDHIRSGEQLRADELLKSGLLAVSQRRDLVAEYHGHVLNSQLIQVAGYTLTAFTESNEQYFRERAASGKPVKVQMLLVEPDSTWAAIMEKTEQKSPGAYLQAFNTILLKMKGIPGVELRLLGRPLPMMIYRIDDILYTGPYPNTGASRLATTLKLASGGWLYRRQQEEFDAMWTSAKSVKI